MKTFCLILISTMLLPLSTFAQGKTNGYQYEVAQAADTLFKSIHADIEASLKSRLKNQTIGAKELDALLAVLDTATNKLHKSDFDKKLAHFGEQADLAHSQAAATLHDPANKEVMAPVLELQEWQNQILHQQYSGAILQSNIIRLRATTEELRKFVSILEPVAVPAQLSERIKLRLDQLLKEWEEPLSNQKVGSQTGSATKPVQDDPSVGLLLSGGVGDQELHSVNGEYQTHADEETMKPETEVVVAQNTQTYPDRGPAGPLATPATMNNSRNPEQTASTVAAKIGDPPPRWWILGLDRRPFMVSEGLLRTWISRGEISQWALVAPEGATFWRPLHTFRQLTN